jgi:hypothetical protein
MDWDFVKIFGGVFGSVAVLVALLVWGMANVDRAACKSQAAQMGFQQSWGMLQGCMIQVRGQWLPIGNYKIIQ